MGDDCAIKQPTTITREELHRLVWQTPMVRLANQFGITGNGLAKICDRLNVPYPPRGYWAKLAAGQSPPVTTLPPSEIGKDRGVTITPTPPRSPDTQQVAAIAADVQCIGAIIVLERLVRPHPVIAHWLADNERRRREARQERDPWRKRFLDPGQFTDIDRRQHRLLDALFKALEKKGGQVKEDEQAGLVVVVQSEKIEVQLREKQKQIRTPRSDGHGGDQKLQPTGKLIFAIKTYLPDGLRREWLETEAKSMEVLLPEIFATLLAAGPLLAEQRRKREEAARQERLEQQRRYEERERRKLDDNRWRRFVEFARSHRDVEAARIFLAALKVSGADEGQQIGEQRLSDWISWAEQSLVARDPANWGEDAIFGDISAVTSWTYRD